MDADSTPSTSPPLDLLAACAFGLEAVVARELTQLGYEPQILDSGRVLFRGDATAIVRANLWLRSADRVLVRLGVFPATDFGQLFDQTFALPWELWIPPEAEFPVNGRSLKSQLSSVPACQKMVKIAVVKKLMAAHGVAELPETGPKFSIEVALHKDQATLVLDTTGPSLHKRGYRTLAGPAPLKETLAAALIQLSYWQPERPLVDPFCGSGTIPIEAAMIGRNIAPGLNRPFAAEEWPAIEASLWREERAAARAKILPELPLRILGYDHDEASLRLARQHAEAAGVAGDVDFHPRTFAQLSSKAEFGCIITNPPYGERMGELPEVQELYRSMPLVLRKLPTWSFFLFTSYPQFEQLLGRTADRRRKLYNGRIECTYYQFHGPPPRERKAGGGAEKQRSRGEDAPPGRTSRGEEEKGRRGEDEQGVRETGGERESFEQREEESAPLSSAPLLLPSSAPPERSEPRAPPRSKRDITPVFGGLSAKAHEQAGLFRSRLTTRARHLRRYPTRQGITCYRLYDKDIPEIPLAVDRYEDCLHIAEYERPHDRSPAEHADWLDLMARTAGETLDVAKANIFLKRRERQKGDSQYERVGDQGRMLIAQEGELKFLVNLSDYLDTGLFLDHRITRGMVRDEAKNKRMLNLFGYTGAFSVYAAAGGAASTTTVDTSNTYLDWARENMELNGFYGNNHRQIRSDALDFLRGYEVEQAYDLAVVDPPTFSNSKRTEEIWDVQRDYATLLNLLVPQMSPGGVIYFSTNFRRFKFDESAVPGVTIREISRQTVPPDFRNERIHRAWRLIVGGK